MQLGIVFLFLVGVTRGTSLEYSCPESRSEPQVVPSGQKIKLSTSDQGQLCTLTRTIRNQEISPLGRSYDGQVWESVAGPFNRLEYECDETYCEVTIPVDSDKDHVYSLVSFHHSLTQKETIARFLEQASFGTTIHEIDKLEGAAESSSLDEQFAKYISNQIHDLASTSHREVWRTHTSPRSENSDLEGRVTHPCEKGTRWRAFSFTEKDVSETLHLKKEAGRFSWSVNGHIRTMVDNVQLLSNMDFNFTPGSNFTICKVTPEMIGIEHEGSCQILKDGNPIIDLKNNEPEMTLLLSQSDLESGYLSPDAMSFTTGKSIENSVCDMIPLTEVGMAPVFSMAFDGRYFIHDPHLIWVENTVEKPYKYGSTNFAGHSKVLCPNAPRTFLNEKSCIMSPAETDCTSYQSIEGSVILDDEHIDNFYQATGKYIYVLTDLRVEDDNTIESPCTPGGTSRWARQLSDCVANIDPSTEQIFSQVLRKFDQTNEVVKDIRFPYDKSCITGEDELKSINVQVDGKCWKSVHPDQGNIYDFSLWAEDGMHPGNEGSQNPIKNSTESGSYDLRYPENYAMSWWNNNKKLFPLIGKLGQTVQFRDFPDHLKTKDVAEIFGFDTKVEGSSVLTCGSPGEVANDASYSSVFDITRKQSEDTTPREEYILQRGTVWSTIALTSSDQLRQRMAWALSQLLVISPDSISVDTNTENFLVYYDIFVRNAFGNYKDILREAAYSPMMANMLTYYSSKSAEYSRKANGLIQFPDENFAREVMQLFTVGSVHLNNDGTTLLDNKEHGNAVYSNEDVTEYARIWTGLVGQERRGNFEEMRNNENNIDPMRIELPWHDFYPKFGLNKRYVGDGYMLCSNLPPKAFLREGANFRLLGNSRQANLHQLFSSGKEADPKNIEIDEQSGLFSYLCNGSIDGRDDCTYPSSVAIPEDQVCNGTECDVESIHIVRLNDVYYEYVQPPCVQFSFFNRGKLIRRPEGQSNNFISDTICAKRGSPVASEACCDQDTDYSTYETCNYTGERVSFQIARDRCKSQGKTVCNSKKALNSVCGNRCCNDLSHFWTGDNCELSIYIDSKGKVAIENYDSIEDDPVFKTYFRVDWKDENFPTHENDCNNVCENKFQMCHCNIRVTESAVFSSTPSREDVMSKLRVGGVPPHLASYNRVETLEDVVMYLNGESIDKNTVFEVSDDYGRLIWLQNIESRVQIGNEEEQNEESFWFRNSPQFFSAVPEERHVHHEIQAALDHLLFHPNTAPFLALRFIQRFGVSNPSPGYIARVVKSFTSGTYIFSEPSSEPIAFGSGDYGDLSAMIASILMDRESRSALLDVDPFHGSFREPLIKVISLMRNLEYESYDKFVSFGRMKNLIGQMAHAIPSVFSFFLPEFSPQGPVSKASLVAPEAMALRDSLGLINGLFSLIKFGLTSDFGGFGKVSSTSAGHLTMFDGNDRESGSVVDKLSLLLTSGRMSPSNREIIGQLFEEEVDIEKALRLAQELTIMTPEFHTTGIVTKNGETRGEIPAATKTCKRHKAVIHIMLKGGCDSYNMLVPHSQCNGKDLFKEYRSVRGPMSLKSESLLPIDASNSNQTCDVFGLHPRLPLLQHLYESKEAILLANVGLLTKPTTELTDFESNDVQLLNNMQTEAVRLDPYLSSKGTGLLGRVSDALARKGMKVNSFSIDDSLSAISGELSNITRVAVNSESGFQRFNPSASKALPKLDELNGETDLQSSVFSETWSSWLHTSLEMSEELHAAQNSTDLSLKFPPTKIGKQLELVAKMIGSQDCRGSERDVFFLEDSTYDHHSEMIEKLDLKFDHLNDALDTFVSEMKNEGKFEDVTIVVSSEFGRTLNGNSGEGTDRGWSGHSFILGGSLDGGKIMGQYPDNLDDGNKYNAGRGTLIPTMPYEAPWNAVAQWLGVDEGNFLDMILPNRLSFPGQLFEKEDIYAISDDELKACDTAESPITCKPKPNVPRPNVPVEDGEESTDDTYSSGNTNGFGDIKEKARTSSGAIIASVLSSIVFLALVLGVYKMRFQKEVPEHKYCSDESVESLFKSTNLSRSTHLFKSANLVQFIGNEEIEVDITHEYSDSDSSPGSP